MDRFLAAVVQMASGPDRGGAAPGDEYRLFPPPAAGEVRAYERRHGRSLPSSFRSFLELANGWRGFMRRFSAISMPALSPGQ